MTTANPRQQQKAVPAVRGKLQAVARSLATPAVLPGRLGHSSRGSATSGQTDGSCVTFLLMMSDSSFFNYLASPFPSLQIKAA